MAAMVTATARLAVAAAGVYAAVAAVEIISQLVAFEPGIRLGLGLAVPSLAWVLVLSSRPGHIRLTLPTLIGLYFSYAGDLIGFLPVKIAAFALAQIAYIVAFWPHRPRPWERSVTLPGLAVIAAVIIAQDDRPLLAGFVPYAALVGFMAYTASGLGFLGAIGGFCFIISDLGVGWAAVQPGVMPTGHLTVSLARAGERWTTQVHRLVARAFIGPRPDGLETRHLDGNPANNRVTNLAYGTHSENAQDRIIHAGPRTHCRRGHPLDETNAYRRSDGSLRCRACRRLRRAMRRV